MASTNGSFSPRVAKIRESLLHAKPELCSERAVAVTESYQETEGEPLFIRRAKALGKVLDCLPIYILPEELLVGHPSRVLRGAQVYPEFGVRWLEQELDTVEQRKQDPFVITSETKGRLRAIIPYWKGRTLDEIVAEAFNYLPQIEAGKEAGVFAVEQNEKGGIGTVLLNYPEILTKGINGVKREVADRLERLDLGDPEYFKRATFWRGCLIVCDKVMGLAQRYAELAQKLADSELNPIRKQELETISNICSHVPAAPAGNFHEALQAVWFLHMVACLETNGTGISLGRMDKYLLPFYERDIASGHLSREEALELVQCFLLKLNESVKFHDNESAVINAGLQTFQNITLGGVDSNKICGSALTSVFLDAIRLLRLPQCHATMLVSPWTPKDMLRQAIECIIETPGQPALMGYNAFIQHLLSSGVSWPEVREFAFVGCVTPSTYRMWNRAGAVYFNIAKALELALNDGVDPLSGKQVGCSTGSPTSFGTFDRLIEAFQEQMRIGVRIAVAASNIIERIHAERVTYPFLSLLLPDCVEQGLDVTHGGCRYNFTRVMGVGLANVANSLAAIKKLVYEDRRLDMKDLLEALQHNFEHDFEEIRRLLLEGAPKFGNDNDYVDGLAQKVSQLFFDEVERYTNIRGGKFLPAYQSLLTNLYFGWKTGATPDGRLARAPLADTISPVHGTDVVGLTGVTKSAAKLDHVRSDGTILNMKIFPLLVFGEEQIQAFADFCRTYLVDLGGSQVQFNVVSGEILREAQRRPYDYLDLMVRVTGYSARFVELCKEVQEDIIGRTEHQHW